MAVFRFVAVAVACSVVRVVCCGGLGSLAVACSWSLGWSVARSSVAGSSAAVGCAAVRAVAVRVSAVGGVGVLSSVVCVVRLVRVVGRVAR